MIYHPLIKIEIQNIDMKGTFKNYKKLINFLSHSFASIIRKKRGTYSTYLIQKTHSINSTIFYNLQNSQNIIRILNNAKYIHYSVII